MSGWGHSDQGAHRAHNLPQWLFTMGRFALGRHPDRYLLRLALYLSIMCTNRWKWHDLTVLMAICLTDGYPTLNLESIMNYQLRNYLVEQALSLGLQNKVMEHSDSCFYFLSFLTTMLPRTIYTPFNPRDNFYHSSILFYKEQGWSSRCDLTVVFREN